MYSYFMVPSGQAFRRPLSEHVISRLSVLDTSGQRTNDLELASARRQEILTKMSQHAAKEYTRAKYLSMRRRLFDFHDRELIKHRLEKSQSGAENRRTDLLDSRVSTISSSYNRWYDEKVRKEEVERLSKSKRDKYEDRKAHNSMEEKMILSNTLIRISGIRGHDVCIQA